MSETEFENQTEQYIRDFPYQETFNYALAYTQDDPSLFNTWVVAAPALIKAGEDKVVRTNNDTFYKMGFVLDHGPVVLRSSAPTRDRFSSLQLMDDRTKARSSPRFGGKDRAYWWIHHHGAAP